MAKVIIVTGASQGIGAEIVKAFRELDYRIVATSRTIEPSEDPNILTVAGDIGDPATAQRVISEAVARFGRVDTLVNNAGIYIGKPFTENSIEDYNAVMNVNMAGFFHITKLAIAEMAKHSSGHVVSVTASIENGITGAHMALAALTKGGLNAATRALAIEYAKQGIRVNAGRAGRHQDADASCGISRSAGHFPSAGPHGRSKRSRQRRRVPGFGRVRHGRNPARRRRPERRSFKRRQWSPLRLS